MEEISQEPQQKNNVISLAIHIIGNKSGFVSKIAIDKFKNAIKISKSYNLEELISKYIKPDFQLTLISKTETEIKFSLIEKVKDLIPVDSNKKKININNLPIETKYTITQEKSSDMINDVIKLIQEKYPNHRIIDITNILNSNTYIEYQKANYYTNIVMVAERTETNEQVFAPRSNSDKSNIIVMSQGAYRTFNYSLMNLVFNSVVEIIRT